MKIIYLLIGSVLFFFGLIIMNLHFFDIEFPTMFSKVFGFLIIILGGFYIDKTLKLGKK